MRFHIHVFGCQMNVGDADWLRRALVAMGHAEAPEDQADIHILLTCSVREKPELKVASALGRLTGLIGRRREAFIAVGGCVAQQLGASLWRRFPAVRLVFGSDGLAGAPAALARLVADPDERLALVDFTDSYPERDQAWPSEAVPAQAFVSIMQGCDNYCAYCIVPFVRGRQKSRPPAAVLDECRELVSRGAREITLLGQNVNSYGLDSGGGGARFAELLTRVGELPGLRRLRFTTSHPKDLSEETIARFADLPTLCPALHLPLQSGSDQILRRMGRRYDAGTYLGLIAKLRAARQDIALSTDIIVGFPGETEDDFLRTLALVEEVGFESAFSFMYSDRPGVAATRLRPKTPPEVAAERLARLQVLLDRLGARALAGRVGRETEVLFEGPARKPSPDGPVWRGRDPAGRVVNVPTDDPRDLTGRFATVRIIEAKKHSLLGKAVRHD